MGFQPSPCEKNRGKGKEGIAPTRPVRHQLANLGSNMDIADSSQPIRASATLSARDAANARARQNRSRQAADENRVKRQWTHRKQKRKASPKTKDQLRGRHEQDQAELAELRQQLDAEKASGAKVTAEMDLMRAAYDAEWSTVIHDLRLSLFDVEAARKRARDGERQWWEEEERRQEQLRAKLSAGEPERAKKERKWAKLKAELDESKSRENGIFQLLDGAGIRDRDELEQLLERHMMTRAEEESRGAAW